MMPTTKSSLLEAAAGRGSKQVFLPGIHGWYAAVLVLLAVSCACVIFTPSATSGAWLWAAAVFIVGMPHGAYDLAAIRRTSSHWRMTARRFTVYSLVMLACLGLVLALPATAVVAFLLLAAHHFGISDSVWTRGRVGLALRDHLVGLGRGLVVLFSPFAFQPSASLAPFASIVRLVRPLADPQPAAAALLAAILVLLGIALVSVASLRTRCRGRAEEWATLGAVVILSAFAPPLVAIGSYFLVIHAFGHCLRALTPGLPVHSRFFFNALRVHRESIPLLVPSVIIVLVLATLVPGPKADAIAVSFLLFCVVATLPHHLLWLASSRWSRGIARPTQRRAGHLARPRVRLKGREITGPCSSVR